MKNRLAVNMLVLNGETVLRRCLVPLKGIIDELVVVDSGSTDDTQHVLEDLATEMKLDRFYYERMHPYSNHFLTDEAETWKMSMPGPFTGHRILKDWAEARNRALDHTHADYVLKFDADDEPLLGPRPLLPENWLRTMDYLDARSYISIVAAPYEIFDGQPGPVAPEGKIAWLSMYDRMWRRVPVDGGRPLRWTQACHEYLLGKTTENTLYTAQGLRVRDWRDSPGAGVRVSHRNLKVLLWDHEHRVPSPIVREDENQETVRLFTLAHEAAEVFPEFAIEILANVSLKIDPWNVSMLSDCYYHKGRALQAMGQCNSAVSAYEEADGIAPHTQALLLAYDLISRTKAWEATRLRDRILARLGADLLRPVSLGADPLRLIPFNCDLGIVARVRGSSG